MPKNWRVIAEGNGLDVPAEDLEKIAPALTALENSFRALAGIIRLETEPAVTLSPEAVDPQ